MNHFLFSKLIISNQNTQKGFFRNLGKNFLFLLIIKKRRLKASFSLFLILDLSKEIIK